MQRILTTHTGSLIRPPAVLDFLDALERGEDVDERAWVEAMAQSVATMVREQSDAGIDIALRALAEGAALATHELWGTPAMM